MRVQWHESPVAFLRLRDEWDRLLEEWKVDCVFLTWDWLRVWLRTYGRGARLLVGIVRDGEEAVGIAPLFISPRRLTRLGPVLRSVQIIGDGPLCPDHLVLPAAPGREREFAEALFAALRARSNEWDRIELRDLLEDHPAWKAFREVAEAAGGHVCVRETTYCPYVSLPGSWDEYMAGLGRKTRATIRQRLKKIERAFETSLSRPSSIREVDRSMAVLEDLHERVWRGRGRAGVFADPLFRLFHRLHARKAFRAGRLALTCLVADGREVGATLCFRGRGRVHGYQLGHDPDLHQYGVGTLIIALSIREAIAEGLREMDFLRGSGPYKFHMASQMRRGQLLTVHRGTFADRLARVLDGSRRRGSGAVRRLLGRRRKQWLKDQLRNR